MRIAFDLDGTLVPETGGVESVSALLRPLFPEALRDGTVSLLRGLIQEGHDVWVYTTSFRPARRVYWWFRVMGVRLGGVVNQRRHEATLRDRSPSIRALSKYPPAFDIDLLVDDLPGVAVEGERHGFAVLVVDPSDVEWTRKVRAAVVEGSHSSVRRVSEDEG